MAVPVAPSGKRPKNTWKTLKKLLAYLGHHRISLLLVAVFACTSSLANILGVYSYKAIINSVVGTGSVQELLLALLQLGALYAFGVLSTYVYNKVMVRTAQEVIQEIRSDLFTHLQTLPLTYFDTHTHGEIMSNFTNDVDTLAEALNNSFAVIIQSSVTVLGTLVMLVVLNFELSLVVYFFMVLMFLYLRHNAKTSRKLFTAQQEELASVNGFVEEMISGQKVEKVFNHEKQDYEEFCRRNEALRKAGTKANTRTGLNVPIVVSLSYINYAVSACLGGLFVMGGRMDIGSLTAYLVYVRQSAMPVNQFTQQTNFMMAALSGAERIFAIMEEPAESDEGEVTLVNAEAAGEGLKECAQYTGLHAWKLPTGELVPLKGDVRFCDVTFGYVPGHNVLKHISLYAKPGQKIAFVGSTGAGKTTITNLINRFYDVQEGAITYDGIDVRSIKKHDLRASLSMVIQDTHLFTGTIADNIRYGRLDATDEEVVAAAKLANADSFIRRLPQGYATMLESDGANLSQGQRQLLAIARAAVSRPPVLILDEATSSVDTHTEKLIERGMDALMEGRTVFVIAHRLSTVRNAQAIMVLEGGQIIERGDHEDLIGQKGRYYKLYTGQFELE